MERPYECSDAARADAGASQRFDPPDLVHSPPPTNSGQISPGLQYNSLNAGLAQVFSSVATPFSRCRAFCRWMLRAGHSSLKANRFRRLRGGLFGWRFRRGAIAPYDPARKSGFADMMKKAEERAILPPTELD